MEEEEIFIPVVSLAAEQLRPSFRFFLLWNKKTAVVVEKAAGKLSGNFLQPLFLHACYLL